MSTYPDICMQIYAYKFLHTNFCMHIFDIEKDMEQTLSMSFISFIPFQTSRFTSFSVNAMLPDSDKKILTYYASNPVISSTISLITFACAITSVVSFALLSAIALMESNCSVTFFMPSSIS